MWNDLLDLTFVEAIWADSADIDPRVLESLFIAANDLCVAYAPPLISGMAVPESFKIAEIFQARHIWTQASGGNRDEMGADGFAVTVYPLVFAARDLLRPKTNPLGRLGL